MNHSDAKLTRRPAAPRDDETPATTGCPPAAQDWLAEHGDALFRYARLRVAKREVAEDLVQDTFLAAISSREPFRGGASVRTWLISILRRKIIDYYRKVSAARARGEVDATGGDEKYGWFTPDGSWQQAVAPWPAPPQIAEDREFWSVLEACLGHLPRGLAAVFVLRELMGLEAAELQESLTLTAGNLRVRLFRARQLLRTCLEKNWFGADGD